jgi:hypothetical protein
LLDKWVLRVIMVMRISLGKGDAKPGQPVV